MPHTNIEDLPYMTLNYFKKKSKFSVNKNRIHNQINKSRELITILPRNVVSFSIYNWIMLSRVSLIALFVCSVTAASEKPVIRGLDPALASKYVPSAQGTFKCLDGSLEIPFARVNDDYCDCPDGSDEPGTSACNNGSFYCANIGHTPARISSRKVNNGVCDPDCCDGSDEWDATKKCPNRCEEVGKQHRLAAEKLEKQTRLGSMKRQELANQASAMRKTKGDELEQKEAQLKELTARYEDAERLKQELEEKEQKQKEAENEQLETRKSKYLPGLIEYRKLLAFELHRMRAQRDSLVLLLRSVKQDHNPGFNDKAVLGAISEYNQFLEHYPYIEAAALEYADEGSKARAEREAIMDKDSADQDDGSLEACNEAIGIFENERETLGDDIELLHEALDKMRAGYNKNYHDLAVKAVVVGLDEYDLTRDADQKVIEKRANESDAAGLKLKADEVKALLGSGQQQEEEEITTVKDNKDTQELADARTKYWDLQNEKNTLNNDVSNLRELLNDKDLGPQDVYMPVKDQCVSMEVAGEYNYEVCLLDRVTQISIKDGTRTNLGSFSGFGMLENGGSDYAMHKYTNGAKCWNGPERSLTATFECAEEIKVLGVTEPEKCEYHAKMTGPFACPLLAEPSSSSLSSKKEKEEVPETTTRGHDEL